MKILITPIRQLFSFLSDILLGKKDDIRVFEEKPRPSLYERITYLTEKYPQNEHIQDLCAEVKEVIELLRVQHTFEAGAFINFCKRIFGERVDMYEVENMLGEVNTKVHAVYKDTVNRKAFEQTLFFQRLEEKLNRMIPSFYEPEKVLSMMEKISQLKKRFPHTKHICASLTELMLKLNNNEKLPHEEIEAFLSVYAPDSVHYFYISILLHAPDNLSLRVLDGFPRIVFIRQIFEDMVHEGFVSNQKETFTYTELSQSIDKEEPPLINFWEKIAQIRQGLIGLDSESALTELLFLCKDSPNLEAEVRKLRNANKTLQRNRRIDTISFAKHAKLSWLWTSWALDLLVRLEKSVPKPQDSNIEDQGNA